MTIKAMRLVEAQQGAEVFDSLRSSRKLKRLHAVDMDSSPYAL
jgi:hypothetical protein